FSRTFLYCVPLRGRLHIRLAPFPASLATCLRKLALTQGRLRLSTLLGSPVGNLRPKQFGVTRHCLQSCYLDLKRGHACRDGGVHLFCRIFDPLRHPLLLPSYPAVAPVVGERVDGVEGVLLDGAGVAVSLVIPTDLALAIRLKR